MKCIGSITGNISCKNEQQQLEIFVCVIRYALCCSYCVLCCRLIYDLVQTFHFNTMEIFRMANLNERLRRKKRSKHLLRLFFQLIRLSIHEEKKEKVTFLHLVVGLITVFFLCISTYCTVHFDLLEMENILNK